MDIINEVLTWLATLNWKWWTEGNNATAVGVIAGIVFAFIAAFWTLYTYIREKRHNPPVTPNNPTIPNVSEENSENSSKTTEKNKEWLKNWNAYVQKNQRQKGFDNFIETQELKLLPESGQDAFQYLLWGSDIAGRNSENETRRDTGKWKEIARNEILKRMKPQCKEGELHRVVVTADAGVGKTRNLNWFWKQLNNDNTLALYIVASELAEFDLQKLESVKEEKKFVRAWCNELSKYCKKELRHPTVSFPEENAVIDFIECLTEQGELVLIVDGLDQTVDEQSLKSLARFLENSNSRAILGGRLHSLATYKESLKLKDRRWRFIRVCEFKEEEQKKYLGYQCLKIIENEIRDKDNTSEEQINSIGKLILNLIAQDKGIETVSENVKFEYWGNLIVRLIHSKQESDADFNRIEYDEYFKSQNKKLHELTSEELITYLGEQRINKIPADAKSLLSVPRILEMLEKLSSDQLKKIHTDCDVFYFATKTLVIQGLKNSVAAKRISPDEGYVHAILGAIAYTMTSDPRRLNEEIEFHNLNELIPNFEGVTNDEDVRKFKQNVIARLKTIKLFSEKSDEEFHWDLDQLPALGIASALEHPIADPELDQTPHKELNQVVWKNRSFQEFYTAYWLANYASEAESDDFKNWVYFHETIESDWYYYINRFLAEMHIEALNTDVWVKSAATWYKSKSPKRSSEMIYRSWWRMHEIAGLKVKVDDWWNISYESLCSKSLSYPNDDSTPQEKPAREVLKSYWSEFQGILDDGNEIAKSFVSNEYWAKIPSATFKMGSSKDEQGFPPKTKAYWNIQIQEVTQKKEHLNGEKLREEIRKIADCCIKSEWFCGEQGKVIRKEDIDDLTEDFLLPTPQAVLDAIEKRFRTPDETPLEPDQEIKEFEIHTLPVLNRTFRLFYPGHKDAQRLSLANFDKNQIDREYPAPEPDHPVNYVSWYDSWAFCQWLRWQDPDTNLFYRCRLPHEPEWEYAAKGCVGNSFPDNQRYWWGNDFYRNEDPADPLKTSEPEHISDDKRAYADGRIGRSTRAPKEADPNGFGLKDVLGNVWEWMANPYEEKYSRKFPDPSKTIAINCKRTMRGGLWYFLNLLSTCTQRYKLVCNDRDYKMGFRVIREEVRKGD